MHPRQAFLACGRAMRRGPVGSISWCGEHGGGVVAAAKTAAWARRQSRRLRDAYLHSRFIVHGGRGPRMLSPRCNAHWTPARATMLAPDLAAAVVAGGGRPGETRAPQIISRLLRAKRKRPHSQQQPSPHCACGLHVIARRRQTLRACLTGWSLPKAIGSSGSSRRTRAWHGRAWQPGRRPPPPPHARKQARRQASGCYHYHHRFHNPI